MPVKHSILITNLDREQSLRVCIASISHSAQVCGTSDYEIVIAGRTTKEIYFLPMVRTLDCRPIMQPLVELGPNEPMPFWKTRLFNQAIQYSVGDVLSFIDADAVVGPLWMENIKRLEDDTLIKLAYRVCYAPYCAWQGEWSERFEKYNTHPISFEAYGSADVDFRERRYQPKPGDAIYGNSQFSIRRDKLGDLRFDERYIGRGWEDVAMNRAIADIYSDAYRCEIVTDGSHAMFHISHEHSPGYEGGRWNSRNRRVYYQQPQTWYVCPDVETAERMMVKDPRSRVVWPPNDKWILSEVIEGLDTVIHIEGIEGEELT